MDKRLAAEALRPSRRRHARLLESVDEGFCADEMQTGLTQPNGKNARELVLGLEQFGCDSYGKEPSVERLIAWRRIDVRSRTSLWSARFRVRQLHTILHIAGCSIAKRHNESGQRCAARITCELRKISLKFERSLNPNRYAGVSDHARNSQDVAAKSVARLAAEEAFLPLTSTRVAGTISLKSVGSAFSRYPNAATPEVEDSRRPRVFRVNAMAPQLLAKGEPTQVPEQTTSQVNLRRPGPVRIVYSKPPDFDASHLLISSRAVADIPRLEPEDNGSVMLAERDAASYVDVQRKLKELDDAIAAIRFAQSVRFDLLAR